MPDFGIFRGFNEKLFGNKLYAGQLPTQLGKIGSQSLILPFEFTINTANTSSGSSTSTQFKLPLTTSTGLDCVVDWGDNTTDNITSHTQPEVTHTYASIGTYTIKITGLLLGWQFNNGGDRLKILDVKTWSILNISKNFAFFGCSNLTASATDAPSITTDNLQGLFLECGNFNGSIGNWNLTGVTNLAQFLQSCSIFNQDISSWDTSSVTIFARMFQNAFIFNQDISSWDTSSVTRMDNMFNNADAFNRDISNWDIDQVNDFSGFMVNATGLSTANYDALLVGWEAQAPISGLSVNFGGSKYTLLSAAATARASLIAIYGWTITDGGGI